MTQTRDNGGKVPTNSDEYQLTQDLATMADSLNVVTVCTSKTQRDTLTKYEGRMCVRTDLGGQTQTVVSGTWVNNYAGPYRHWRATSTQNLSGTGSTWTVNLPPGYFTTPPHVMVTKANSAGAGYNPYVVSVTTSAVIIGAYWQGNSTGYAGVQFNIDAIQMTPGTAGGVIGD